MHTRLLAATRVLYLPVGSIARRPRYEATLPVFGNSCGISIPPSMRTSSREPRTRHEYSPADDPPASRIATVRRVGQVVEFSGTKPDGSAPSAVERRIVPHRVQARSSSAAAGAQSPSALGLGRVETQRCFWKVEFPSRNRSPESRRRPQHSSKGCDRENNSQKLLQKRVFTQSRSEAVAQHKGCADFTEKFAPLRLWPPAAIARC
jgi:hypothetical protein